MAAFNSRYLADAWWRSPIANSPGGCCRPCRGYRAALCSRWRALCAARDALILIYISGLIAMGFSPLVEYHSSRARKATAAGCRDRSPSSSSISPSSACSSLVALVVVPPLVAQATALWQRVPEIFDDLQRLLIRYRLMRATDHPAGSGAERAAGSGRNAVGTVLIALSTFRRRVRRHHGFDSQLLLPDRSALDVRLPDPLRAGRADGRDVSSRPRGGRDESQRLAARRR